MSALFIATFVACTFFVVFVVMAIIFEVRATRRHNEFVAALRAREGGEHERAIRRPATSRR